LLFICWFEKKIISTQEVEKLQYYATKTFRNVFIRDNVVEKLIHLCSYFDFDKESKRFKLLYIRYTVDLPIKMVKVSSSGLQDISSLQSLTRIFRQRS
jgi:hypothetical protein